MPFFESLDLSLDTPNHPTCPEVRVQIDKEIEELDERKRQLR